MEKLSIKVSTTKKSLTNLKTQQTPKDEAQEPLAVPPLAEHSLELEEDGGDDHGADGHGDDDHGNNDHDDQGGHGDMGMTVKIVS